MSSKKEILKKIKIILTQNFDSQEDAFNYFDKNNDKKLDKSEIINLLKQAEISGFLRSIVAKKLIEGYDDSSDKKIDWKEFKKAIKEM